MEAVAQRGEVRRVGDRPRLRGGAGEQELAELLAVVVLPDERPDVLAGGAVVAFGDLVLDEALHLVRSEEHTSELQSLMRISYAVVCLKKKKNKEQHTINNNTSPRSIIS